MATWTGDIELRRLHVEWARTPTGGVVEDREICTFHFLNLTGGTPDSTWLDADYAQVETAFDAFWTSLKVKYTSRVTLTRYRWYKAGAAWDVTPAPYNPSVRDTTRAVAGSVVAGTMQLPPQLAISVTERNDQEHRRWGRFYLPAPAVDATVVDGDGRIPDAFVDALGGYVLTFYNACRGTNNLIPVVFSRARGAYERRDGTVLGARGAEAHSVDRVQVDNIYDVIRSRRWANTTKRYNTAVT